MALSFVAIPMLMVGNYFGGELVFRLGMRVNTGRLPEPPLIVKAVAVVRRRLGVREPA